VFKKQVKIGTSRGYRGIKVLQKPDPGQFWKHTLGQN
jgi:hypothetical protein